MPTVRRRPDFASNGGSILLEVLLVAVVLGLIGAWLFAALLGANRSVGRAGQYTAATALAHSVIEEMRLYAASDPRLEPGLWEWCPPDCPDRIDRVAVEVELPAEAPGGLRRVTVLVFRTGTERPVKVVSHVHP